MNKQQFWTWFQDNEQKIYILPLLSIDEQEEYVYWLKTYLSYYCEGIDIQIQFSESYTTPATLALFFGENLQIRIKTLQLVESAPPMDNWIVTTYHTKKEEITESKTVGSSNFKLNINQLYFQPIFKNNQDTKITINIFTTKKVSYAKRKQFKKLCIQCIITIIGEESLKTHIQLIRCNLKLPVPGVAIKVIHISHFIKILN